MLVRGCDADGPYETCKPHHSWNSNQVFPDWAVLHRQRHFDHHARPLRRYQCLLRFENLPLMPSSCFGMHVVA